MAKVKEDKDWHKLNSHEQLVLSLVIGDTYHRLRDWQNTSEAVPDVVTQAVDEKVDLLSEIAEKLGLEIF